MKELLFVLLLSISSVIHANWAYINKSEDLETVFYIDVSTIQFIDGNVRAWFKSEFSPDSFMARKHNWRSARSLNEYNCRENKYRVLSLTSFKQSNLNDINKTSNVVSEWVFVAPNTISETHLKLVCSFNK
jgi:hypothetical protein